MKFISALVFSAFTAAFALPVAANAEPSQTSSGKVAKAEPSKAAAKRTDSKSKAAAQKDEAEPDIASATPTEINCELGNKLTIYRDLNNDQEIALRWEKKLRRLQRVMTTTGAHRFEDKTTGLVWIDIPAKGMLLDSKMGRQLANECISASR